MRLLSWRVNKTEAKQPEKPDDTRELLAEMDSCKRRLALYRRIFERYAEIIAASEEKSVLELRALVEPENAAVQEAKRRIAAAFKPYVYQDNFMAAAEMALEHVAGIKTETLPVEFWLKPEDMAELGVAGDMDKAILLCALLIALGNESAKVSVAEAENGLKLSLVTFEFGGRHYLLDPGSNAMRAGASAERLLETHESGGSRVIKILYDFNNTEYNEW
jgi:hypothetical protein